MNALTYALTFASLDIVGCRSMVEYRGVDVWGSGIVGERDLDS